jgi:hypothetical protein
MNPEPPGHDVVTWRVVIPMAANDVFRTVLARGQTWYFARADAARQLGVEPQRLDKDDCLVYVVTDKAQSPTKPVDPWENLLDMKKPRDYCTKCGNRLLV